MKGLTEILEAATARIESGYFHVALDGGDPVYRERVYAYELYHQMRSRWPADTPYFLNGELDKSAHPVLTGLGVAGRKPDLLVHQPGYMNANHAAIELKHAKTGIAGIKKDLRTLALFRTNVRYERAIYLVYGHYADDRLLGRIRSIYRQLQTQSPIEIWFHRRPHEPARQVELLQA